MSKNINTNLTNSKDNNDDINIIIDNNNNQSDKNTSNNLRKNYFIQAFLSDKITNTIIMILLPIIIFTELFYRKPLFNLSLTVEKHIQNFMGDKDSTPIIIFKIITDFGGDYFMVIGIVIVYWFFSIVETFTYTFGFLFSLYIHCVMKVWYASLRPNWEDPSLFIGVCDGSFGNPSGHSFISFFNYLTLLRFVLDHKNIKDKDFLKIILIILFLLWSTLVAFSRVVLGAHSINQIIFGTLLGMWVSLCITHVFKCDKITAKYYRSFFREKQYIIFFTVYVILCIIISIISTFIFNQNLDYDELNKKLNKNCSVIIENKRFNYASLKDSILISGFFGLYCGQCLFWYLIDNKYKGMNLIESGTKEDANNGNDIFNEDYFILDELINKWSSNRSQLFKPWWNIFKLILVLVISLIPITMILFIPSTINIGLMVTFKIAVPYFIIGFLIFSIGLYEFIFITCGKKEFLLECKNKNEKMIS